MTDAELIREAVKKSGLSARAFAENITWRDERTVRRWMSGDQELPTNARKQLEWFIALSDPQRKALVDAAGASFRVDRDAAPHMAELRLTDETIHRRWSELLAVIADEFNRAGIQDVASCILHNPDQRFVSIPFLSRNGQRSFGTKQVDSETLLNGSLRLFARAFAREFLRLQLQDDLQTDPQLRTRVQTEFPGSNVEVEYEPDIDDRITPMYWLVLTDGRRIALGGTREFAGEELQRILQ